jgi:hypothetical protein
VLAAHFHLISVAGRSGKRRRQRERHLEKAKKKLFNFHDAAAIKAGARARQKSPRVRLD